MMQDYRDVWLSEQGRQLNINSLNFDKDGLARLKVNQGIYVLIKKQVHADTLTIIGRISTEKAPQTMLEEMLIANRLGEKEPFPVFSLSRDRNAIEAHIHLNQFNLDLNKSWVEIIIQSLEYFRDFGARQEDMPEGKSNLMNSPPSIVSTRV